MPRQIVAFHTRKCDADNGYARSMIGFSMQEIGTVPFLRWLGARNFLLLCNSRIGHSPLGISHNLRNGYSMIRFECVI